MRKDPFRWLSVKQAMVNLIRGLSTGISLLSGLAPASKGATTGLPSRSTTSWQDLAGIRQVLTTLNTGRMGRNQHVMDLLFTTEKNLKAT